MIFKNNIKLYGLVKYRFSDFIVNEIDENNNKIIISNTCIPSPLVTIINIDEIKNYVNSEALEGLKSLENNEVGIVEISVENYDKNILTKIHNYIRQNYEKLSK